MGLVAPQLRLADLLAGLSMVADMGYGLPSGEAMRSCLVGMALARRLGLSEQQVADTLYTSLLAHVGCVGYAHEMSAAFGDDLAANRAGSRTNFADPRDIFSTLIPETVRGLAPLPSLKAGAFIITRGRAFGRRYDTTTCEVARVTARRVGLGDSVQQSLFQVREWWNGGGSPRGLAGEDILSSARVARVAADAVLFDALGGIELVVHALSSRAGGVLDPSIVSEFVTDAPSLLEAADTGDPRERILTLEPGPVVEIASADLPDVAAAFGHLADLKTPFTHGHSSGVAHLARAAAQGLGIDRETVGRLHVAALLHDIGRVGVSNAIWEKPGPLTSPEWEQVRMHPYHAERVLATSHGFEPMAEMAGRHHERLDGSGYHRGCRARDLPPATRVLAAADAFQAMTEPRPHRPALEPERAAEELRSAVSAGGLDHDAAEAVIAAAGQRVQRRRSARPAGLSEREIEVLQQLSTGCSNREIAERLYISRRTAEHHVQHVYTKIGVSTRAAAALFALEHDLIPPAP